MAKKKTNRVPDKEAQGIGRKTKSTISATSTGGSNEFSSPKTQYVLLSPYDIFLRCIKRAENLINFHSVLEFAFECELFCSVYINKADMNSVGFLIFIIEPR